ncbi:MAG: 3-dehydroquinate synthase [Rubripirellula sp.]
MVTPTQGDPDRALVRLSLDERSYDIHITTGEVNRFAECLIGSIPDLSHAIVVADQAVSDLADQIAVGLESQESEIRASRRDVPSGEPSKSIEQFESLLQWILSVGGDRRSVVVAVGGGVIGDLAGFVAASFARGIRLVQVPTTLLSMVDSSVGGKTGVNLPAAKNMVGAFWQPSLVLIDTEVMSTLPQRSYLSGLAEVIKYGVIDDSPFFAWLESNATALVDRSGIALRHAIESSCRSKARVVAEDERETTGRRAILNYGHTFAHAIEANAGYGKLLHGEAVAIGMQMAAQLALRLQMADSTLLQRQTELIEACQLPTRYQGADPDKMIPVMMRDKKVAYGKLRFILPTEIGVVELVGGIDEADVRAAIESAS